MQFRRIAVLFTSVVLRSLGLAEKQENFYDITMNMVEVRHSELSKDGHNSAFSKF